MKIPWGKDRMLTGHRRQAAVNENPGPVQRLVNQFPSLKIRERKPEERNIWPRRSISELAGTAQAAPIPAAAGPATGHQPVHVQPTVPPSLEPAPSRPSAVHQGIQSLNRSIEELPPFDSVNGLVDHLGSLLLSTGRRPPDCMVLGAPHGRVGGLAAGLTLLLVQSFQPGPKVLLLEGSQEKLTALGLVDSNSNAIRGVLDNLADRRPVLHGFEYDKTDPETVAHMTVDLVCAAFAHRLGFQVASFNPLWDETRASEHDPARWETQEVEMRKALRNTAEEGTAAVVMSGLIHALPLREDPEASAKPWVTCLMSPIPIDRPELADRFGGLLARKNEIPLFRTTGHLDQLITNPDVVATLVDQIDVAARDLDSRYGAAVQAWGSTPGAR